MNRLSDLYKQQTNLERNKILLTCAFYFTQIYKQDSQAQSLGNLPEIYRKQRKLDRSGRLPITLGGYIELYLGVK